MAPASVLQLQLCSTTNKLAWYAYYLSDHLTFYRMLPDFDEMKLKALAEKQYAGEFIFDNPKEVESEFSSYKKFYVGIPLILHITH